MKLSQIQRLPTTHDCAPGEKLHINEQDFRSWHIVERVKEWLASGWSSTMILELIELMEEK